MISNFKNIFGKYKRFEVILEILVLVSVGVFVLNVHNSNIRDRGTNSDVGVEFRTGLDIRRGINPYSRITTEDLLRNEKFATLLPLYYYFLLGIAHITDYQQDDYLNLFRIIIYIAQFTGAMFLYLYFRKKNHRLLGLLACSFFLMNRWAIDSTADLKQDTIAVTFLIVSLYFFKTKPKISYFLYGMSLATKHIGIFVFPAFLIPFVSRKKPVKELVLDFMWLFIPVLAPTLVFIFDDLKSFVLSMLFGLTRATATNSSMTFGYEKILVKYNPTGIKLLTPLYYMLPRVLLLSFSGLLSILVLLKKIPVSFYVFASFLVFATFNPVVYDQYLVWAMAFAFFGVADYLEDKPETQAS